MGQKTHPLGFRLGITQDHKSTWYSNFNQYANILKEDDQIRTYIDTISKKNRIANVKINRNLSKNQIQLIIETGSPGKLVGPSGNQFDDILDNITKISNRQVNIKVLEVKRANATLLANKIVEKLEKRVAFRKVIREELKTAMDARNIQGIKIQVSGRLNGAEIARSEWLRDGRVPLQTLRADIDYATREANTIYGVLGIKVWLFRSEILSK